MAEFSVKPGELKRSVSEQEEYSKTLRQMADKLDTLADSSSLGGNSYAIMKRQLKQLASAVRNEQSGMEGIKKALSDITNLYEDTEKKIAGNKAGMKKIKAVVSSLEKQLKDIGNNGGGSSQRCGEYGGDPVNMCNGNYVDEVKEIEIAGSIPLSFVRYYNALGLTEHSMGTSWSHNYETALKMEENALLLKSGDGKEERFEKADPNGSMYFSVYGSMETIQEREDGFFLSGSGKDSMQFDSDGILLSCMDLLGNSIRFFYDRGRLIRAERVSIAMEKSLQNEYELETLFYHYNKAGYLERVCDHTGRNVLMSYLDGLLSEVEAADHGKTAYTYDENRRIRTVQNAAGYQKLENTYDEKGRVICQTFADGAKMQYAYEDDRKYLVFTDRNNNQITYVHDEKMRHTHTITDEGTESYSYNEQNFGTEYTDKNGNEYRRTFDHYGNITSIIDPRGGRTCYTYDAKGRLVSVRNAAGGQTRWHYDNEGKLTEIITPDQAVTKIGYDDVKRAELITRPDGSSLRLTYDMRGNITGVKEDGKGDIHYAYDTLNRVTESIDGEGNRTAYTYDEKDRLLSVTDADQNVKRYQYQETGKVASIIDFDGAEERFLYGCIQKPISYQNKSGQVTAYEYDSMRNISKVVSPNGGITSYKYDRANHLIQVTNPLGHSLQYTYDGMGNRTSEKADTGVVLQYGYDAVGNCTSMTDADGNIMHLEYDSLGKLIRKTDAVGNVTTYTYDTAGHLTGETDALGGCTAYTYTPLGKLSSILDKAGRKTECLYYPGGLLREVRLPDGTKETYTYNGNGKLASRMTREGTRLTYCYDKLSRIRSVEGSSGEKKTYSYDVSGNVTGVTDARGNTAFYTYSPAGKLTSVTDAVGNTTYYTYDEMDQLIGILQGGETEPDLHRSNYERDLAGQVIEVTDPLGAVERYTYDAAGHLTGKIDRDGYETRYDYTMSGDPAQITYADGKQVVYEYDALRRIQNIHDWLGKTIVEYDALSRIKRVKDPKGQEVGYAYGSMGERREVCYPDGTKAEYHYDDALRLCEVVSVLGKTTFAYDVCGRLFEKHQPNGIQTTYTYNSAGYLSNFTQQNAQGILEQNSYTYDVLGNKTGMIKKRQGLEEESGSYAYEYDALNRLLEVEKDGHLLRSFRYDACGNRIASIDQMQGREDYRYDVAGRLLQILHSKNNEQLQVTAFNYDGRGNRKEVLENGRQTKQFYFGPLNRLDCVITERGEHAEYEYNGLGHRILESTPDGNRSYITDITRPYYNLLAKEEHGSIQDYIWDGNILGSVENGIIRHALTDELGSTTRCLDETGQIAASFGYDEFGNDLYGNQGELQPFGYTGYRFDRMSETWFAQAREYDSTQGRFISEDTVRGYIATPETLNHYGYCWQNPFTYVDLNGAWPSLSDVEDSVNKAASDVIRDFKDNYWNKNVYGEDRMLVDKELGQGTYQVKTHEGGNIFVLEKSAYNKVTGWSINMGVDIPGTNISLNSQLSGTGLNLAHGNQAMNLLLKIIKPGCRRLMLSTLIRMEYG